MADDEEAPAAPKEMTPEMLALLTGKKVVDEVKPPTPPARVPEEHPIGVVSLYLMDATCKQFQISKKEIVNNQHFKLDTKVVKEDMQVKGAISDFSVVKDSLMNYTEDYLLARYIGDDRYMNDHNFEIVVTIEQRDAIETAFAEQKALEEGHDKGPRFWESLGSEKEVDNEIVKSTRDPIVLRATKKQKDFYQKLLLADQESIETWSSSQMECRPFRDPSFDKFILEQDIAVQAIPITKDTGAQTVQKVHRNNQVQYASLVVEAPEAREVLSSQKMGDFLVNAKPRYVDALQQNEVFDLFEDEFAQFVEDDYQHGDRSITSISEFQTFMDLNYGKSKMVSAIDWMPGKRGIVAAAVSASISFDERAQVAGRPASSHVLLWTFQDPIHPWAVLESSSDVFSLQFNPVKPTLIAGGCYNGQVIVWDIAKAQDQQDRRDRKEAEENTTKDDNEKKKGITTPVVLFALLSTMNTSHTGIVSDIHWLHKDFQLNVEGVANNGETNLIASISADGSVIFWDITKTEEPELDSSWSDERKYAAYEERKYMWTPLYKLETRSESPNRQVGPLKMAQGTPGTVYFCSTEFGEVTEIDLNLPRGSPNVAKITIAHQGPVRALLRSPFFDNVLLSIGIWTFALWKDNVEKPIYVSKSSEGYLTTGCWSPTRPAVVYIGLIDGTIEVWDLLDHTHQPSMTATVSSCQLTSMEFWKMQTPQFLAVGDIQGILHIMEIPRNLRRATYKEKPAMKNFFMRQAAWVADVETRAEGRGAAIAKSEDVQGAEKEREEQFFKTCTWDAQAELEYQEFEERYRIEFASQGVTAEDPDSPILVQK